MQCNAGVRKTALLRFCIQVIIDQFVRSVSVARCPGQRACEFSIPVRRSQNTAHESRDQTADQAGNFHRRSIGGGPGLHYRLGVLPLPPQLQGRPRRQAQLEQDGRQHVGRSSRPVVHSRPARDALDGRVAGNWRQLHGTEQARCGRRHNRIARSTRPDSVGDLRRVCLNFKLRSHELQRLPGL